MTTKERFLAAVSGQVPDRVPATPDTSNYIPAKRTGLPFWDIYYHGKIPLWRAYLDVADYFGADAWVACCAGVPTVNKNSRVEWRREARFTDDGRALVWRNTVKTPDGELTSEYTCFRADPPSPTERLIKDLERDFPKYRWLLDEPTGINTEQFEEVRAECRRRGHAFGLSVGYPGFQAWEGAIQGSVQALAYALSDCPHLLDEWHDRQQAQCVKIAELALAAGMDYLQLGGSGTITLASPTLARRYAIPTIKRITEMAARAGVPTVLHSCGRSRAFVDMLVEETQLNCITPLEIPPMGDVDLAELKRARGRQIALMGNLHTTAVMLEGTPETVRRKSLEAMAAAGEGGGFILSTGDQCPRETPDENLFALIETTKQFGVYDRDGKLPRVAEALRG